MAQTTTLNLSSNKAHPGVDGVPANFVGEAYEAASYYTAGSNLQTVAWSFESIFSASVFIDGTLQSTPMGNDWFTIAQLDLSKKSGFINFSGNFTLLRARIINWTTGSVNFISVSY